MNGKQLTSELNNMKLRGVVFEAIRFTPKADSIAASHPKYRDESCEGVFIKVTDRKNFRPVQTGLMLLQTVRKLYSSSHQADSGLFKIQKEGMERLLGVSENLNMRKDSRIHQSESVKELPQSKHFRKIRKKYLLYR